MAFSFLNGALEEEVRVYSSAMSMLPASHQDEPFDK